MKELDQTFREAPHEHAVGCWIPLVNLGSRVHDTGSYFMCRDHCVIYKAFDHSSLYLDSRHSFFLPLLVVYDLQSSRQVLMRKASQSPSHIFFKCSWITSRLMPPLSVVTSACWTFEHRVLVRLEMRTLRRCLRCMAARAVPGLMLATQGEDSANKNWAY